MGDIRNKDKADLHMTIHIMRAMYKTLEEDWAKQAKQYHLTSPQQHLLSLLFFRDGSTVSEVATMGLWHISTAMHLLDKLEEKGLIRKERLRHDKRASRVYLTSQGKDILNQLNEDLSNYKIYNVIQSMSEAHGIGWERLLDFSKAVTQELYGREYVDFLESSHKQIQDQN
jgi:MarR family protease production transcriptional regulator HPr